MYGYTFDGRVKWCHRLHAITPLLTGIKGGQITGETLHPAAHPHPRLASSSQPSRSRRDWLPSDPCALVLLSFTWVCDRSFWSPEGFLRVLSWFLGLGCGSTVVGLVVLDLLESPLIDFGQVACSSNGTGEMGAWASRDPQRDHRFGTTPSR
ncbi:hypothetical protein MUK42_34329 [Musa troglodytarum]|uniref:Uncharacterized protein n=1 Tax=Musa troglodytarum TaxID=320322 RepID=A0A9E7GKI1_9LILI|nr:hypothetical protein MUK42_34329 [Musa troglodytarum]